MKSIVILGSTGSIGTNTWTSSSGSPKSFGGRPDRRRNNDEKLEEQIRRFRPQAVAMSRNPPRSRLRAALLRTADRNLSG